MHYASPRHERTYRNITRGKGYPSHTLAALFLLTSQRKLWKSYCKSVSNAGIDWTAGRSIDTGWDGFTLERTALSIAKSTAPQVTLRDLTCRIDYPQELLRLVITAIWIARNDPKITTEIIIAKGKRITC